MAHGAGWTDGATPHVSSLSAEDRGLLASAWLASTRMEHASIPAFAQLSMHLAALGAPSDLVERSHRAALEELAHARRCFAIASAYAGATLAAGRIQALGRGGDPPIDLIGLAVGSLVDGCLAEGIAADVAARGARAARDPVIRDAFTTIARDEATHAELGWSVLEWALVAGGDAVVAAVAARVDRLRNELAPSVPELAGFDRERLAPHGLCDQSTLGDIAARRIEQVRIRACDLLDLVIVRTPRTRRR